MTIKVFPASTNVDGGDVYGKIIASNSSSTPLTNGSSFTGDWVDVSTFDSLVVAVATDQNGTYKVEYSTDETNVDSTLTRFYRTSQINPPNRFTNARQYARVVFTNDSGSDQTYFRLQTQGGVKQLLNAPLDGTVSQDFDSTLVRPTSFNIEVAQGIRQGWTTWNKWGYNGDVDSAAEETVWSVGGIFVPLPTAQTLDVSSSSVNDTSAGTGAQSVIIYGVDGNYRDIIEVVTLNGTSAVTTTNTFLGVNRVAIYLAGSTQSNVGTITVEGTSSATTQAEIPPTKGSTQHAFFFVEEDSNFYADWLWINVGKPTGGGSPKVTVRAIVTSLVSGAQYEVFQAIINTNNTTTLELKPSQPFVVGEKSLFELRASTDSNNTVVNARFSGIQGKLVGAS